MGQNGGRNGTVAGQNVDSGQKQDKSGGTYIDKEHPFFLKKSRVIIFGALFTFLPNFVITNAKLLPFIVLITIVKICFLAK